MPSHSLSQDHRFQDRRSQDHGLWIAGLHLRKLPARSQAIVFPMLLSLLMSLIVSAVATLKAFGLEDGVVLRILQAWGMSYAVAFPAALLAIPVVRRVVAAVVQTEAKRG